MLPLWNGQASGRRAVFYCKYVSPAKDSFSNKLSRQLLLQVCDFSNMKQLYRDSISSKPIVAPCNTLGWSLIGNIFACFVQRIKSDKIVTLRLQEPEKKGSNFTEIWCSLQGGSYWHHLLFADRHISRSPTFSPQSIRV